MQMNTEDPLEESMATYSGILGWRISLDRGAWQAIVHGGHKESDTTERLDNNKPLDTILIITVNRALSLETEVTVRRPGSATYSP